MNLEELIAVGTSATLDFDDIERVYTGSLDDRKRALMRRVAGAYAKGWDECEQAFTEALALAGLNLTVPVARA